MRKWIERKISEKILGELPYPRSEKYKHEIDFWRKTIENYVLWYKGEIPEFYGEPAPTDSQKVRAKTLKHRAILTWEKVHQYNKYLQDLDLTSRVFSGKKLLDLGSGPHFSSLAYRNANTYCLDPLWPEYLYLGFPTFHSDLAKVVCSFAEDMPFEDNFFDAVISVNALDHVDDFEATVNEIGRVLKPRGKVRIHLHYHSPTNTEPLVLDDKRVRDAFSWCKRFEKLSESNTKRGCVLQNQTERYVLWSNFT